MAWCLIKHRTHLCGVVLSQAHGQFYPYHYAHTEKPPKYLFL